MVVISNLPPPDHGIRHQQANTSAVINEKTIGIGTLYITESQLSWVNSASGEGFSLEYPHISIHAVSRDRQTYPEECLYLLIDALIEIPGEEARRRKTENAPAGGGGGSGEPGGGEAAGGGEGSAGGGEEEEKEEEEGDGMTELRFIPQDKACLDAMYTAMSDCQALHPDSQDSFSEDEEENDDEDEGVEADDGFDDFENPEGSVRHGGAQNGDSEMDVDEGQFEDAPDD